MKKYRLKKAAVPFFKEEHATSIYDFETWDGLGVDINALDEVEDCFIKYGIKTSKTSSNLSGWNQDDGSHFHFTIIFPSVKWQEHDKFSDGRMVRELMDEIQEKVGDFYERFIDNDLLPKT